MAVLRYIMCAVLALGALGHLYGTFDGYPLGSEVFVWSLSATAFTLAVVTFNILARSGDRTLLTAAMISAFAWGCLAILFGSAIDNVMDPRVIAHVVPSFILAALDTKAVVQWKSPKSVSA